MPVVPALTLNSGAAMPQLGIGVFQVDPRETKRVVLDALEVGYRHIDTAAGYGNALFITTKQRPGDQAADRSRGALQTSLDKLGLASVDLYLIHWPTPARGLYVESWLALEQFEQEGLSRSIGVSNFLPEYLDRLRVEGSVVPAVNQIELHPRLQQRDVADHSRNLGIQIEAWSPIARGALMENPEIDAIAAKYGKSIAQVTLRWNLDSGNIVIPRTVHKERMVENFDLFDFTLLPEEIAVFDAQEAGDRVGNHPATMNNA
jgi:2,5-diketo-D-gluconate reductase A